MKSYVMLFAMLQDREWPHFFRRPRAAICKIQYQHSDYNQKSVPHARRCNSVAFYIDLKYSCRNINAVFKSMQTITIHDTIPPMLET